MIKGYGMCLIKASFLTWNRWRNERNLDGVEVGEADMTVMRLAAACEHE